MEEFLRTYYKPVFTQNTMTVMVITFPLKKSWAEVCKERGCAILQTSHHTLNICNYSKLRIQFAMPEPFFLIQMGPAIPCCMLFANKVDKTQQIHPNQVGRGGGGDGKPVEVPCFSSSFKSSQKTTVPSQKETSLKWCPGENKCSCN